MIRAVLVPSGVFSRLALRAVRATSRERPLPNELAPVNRADRAESHGMNRSTVRFMALRGTQPAPLPCSLLGRLLECRLRQLPGPIERIIHDARRRGARQAWAAWAQLSRFPP